jgi:cellulose synthase/poly-beta-1,6-N-acetylglucosamine synthase-like glycosyltransferase
MMSFLSTSFAVVAAFLALPTSVFALEVFASVFSPQRSDLVATKRRARLGVIVPAHNEAAGILATLNDIKDQLGPDDPLLVVADNCSDETAAVAAAAGADVSVRSDPTKIGKGYALDWGLRQFALSPPDIVIVIDADCRLAEHAIDRLAYACQESNRPVQSLYLMAAPEGSRVNHQVAEFAWRVKNYLRPRGLSALGLPCQLMGSGMAFPWAVIRPADLSSGHVVEDLKLGLDLAAHGWAPVFCPSALVTSTFPSSAEGAKRQRQRWEHGQIGLVLTTAIPRVRQALREGNFGLLTLILDLMVPPLSLFLVILMASVIVTGLARLMGGAAVSFSISLGCFAVVILATVVSWIAAGRDVLPPKSLALVPLYMLTKLRHYIAAALGERILQWARADRS